MRMSAVKPWNIPSARTSGAHTMMDVMPSSLKTSTLSTLRFGGLPASTSFCAIPSPNPLGVNRRAIPVRPSNSGANTRSVIGTSIS